MSTLKWGFLTRFHADLLKSLYTTFCAKIFQNFKKKAKRHIQKLLSKEFSMYNDFFASKTDTRFKVEYKTFVNNFTKIKDNINTLNKRHQAKRKEIPETFTRKVMEELGIKTSTLPDQLQDFLRGH